MGYFKARFTIPPPDFLSCGICNQTLCNPVQICSDFHVICRDCLTLADRCPDCQAEISQDRVDNLTTPRHLDINLARLIGSLVVKCLHAIKGCQWVGTVAKEPEHISECTFSKTKCPNHNCIVMLVPRDLERHLRECPHTFHPCVNSPNCSHKSNQSAMFEHGLKCEYNPCMWYSADGCPFRGSCTAVAKHQQYCNRLHSEIETLHLRVKLLEARGERVGLVSNPSPSIRSLLSEASHGTSLSPSSAPTSQMNIHESITITSSPTADSTGREYGGEWRKKKRCHQEQDDTNNSSAPKTKKQHIANAGVTHSARHGATLKLRAALDPERFESDHQSIVQSITPKFMPSTTLCGSHTSPFLRAYEESLSPRHPATCTMDVDSTRNTNFRSNVALSFRATEDISEEEEALQLVVSEISEPSLHSSASFSSSPRERNISISPAPETRRMNGDAPQQQITTSLLSQTTTSPSLTVQFLHNKSRADRPVVGALLA